MKDAEYKKAKALAEEARVATEKELKGAYVADYGRQLLDWVATEKELKDKLKIPSMETSGGGVATEKELKVLHSCETGARPFRL